MLGSKADTWFAVDPLTGVKIQTLNMDGSQQVCPSGSVPTVFIGRTGVQMTHKLHQSLFVWWGLVIFLDFMVWFYIFLKWFQFFAFGHFVLTLKHLDAF